MIAYNLTNATIYDDPDKIVEHLKIFFPEFERRANGIKVTVFPNKKFRKFKMLKIWRLHMAEQLSTKPDNIEITYEKMKI